MIAGEGRQWQRAVRGRRWKNPKERKRQQGVFKHFAIVEHFLFCTKSVPIGIRTAESFIKAMADIGNLNWISFLRCSIMNLSPLFSSKDRFSPLPQRAFFCPAPFPRRTLPTFRQRIYAVLQNGRRTMLLFCDRSPPPA
jgi:hypothetical protein